MLSQPWASITQLSPHQRRSSQFKQTHRVMRGAVVSRNQCCRHSRGGRNAQPATTRACPNYQTNPFSTAMFVVVVALQVCTFTVAFLTKWGMGGKIAAGGRNPSDRQS
eukprot:scaffold63122_cov21-Tisochrysis_lutea.AAC.1